MNGLNRFAINEREHNFCDSFPNNNVLYHTDVFAQFSGQSVECPSSRNGHRPIIGKRPAHIAIAVTAARNGGLHGNGLCSCFTTDGTGIGSRTRCGQCRRHSLHAGIPGMFRMSGFGVVFHCHGAGICEPEVCITASGYIEQPLIAHGAIAQYCPL